MRYAAAALAAFLLIAHGGAHALFDDDIARARIEELRKQVDAMGRLVDERLARVEAKAEDRRALVELASQIEALKGDIARMRGQLEVLQNQTETADKRGKDLYIDIDTRLRKLEQLKEAAAPEKPAADAGPPPAEVKAYEAALNLFKAGNYPLAISAFQLFLHTYPSSKLAPNSQYWIGNAQAAQGQHKLAIATHQKLLTTWPDDAKAPDAMAGIANAQDALGDRRGAQKTLEGLLAKYPQSPAAASAKQRLQQGTKK
ncbi:MAG: tol-pal system protein YbgF [Betaproteobacteria bacterium]